MIHSKKHTRAIIKTLARHLQGRLQFGVEVGVWTGNNSANLLRHFPELRLTMVDHWSASVYREVGKDKRMRSKSQQHYSQALRMALTRTHAHASRRIIIVGHSLEVAAGIRQQSQDFVFIDADHSYRSVLCDIAAWRTKVRPGGLLMGHDYNSKGDKLGLFGVKRAVDETFGEQNVNVVHKCCMWWVMM